LARDLSGIRKSGAEIERDSQEIQDFLVKMLRIKAVNPRMGGSGELERAEFLEAFLKAEGFAVKRADAEDPETGKRRPNVCARVEGKGKKTLWLISHMDTVPEGSAELWRSDPFDPVVKDGKIFARGAEDNGQALVSSLFALRELKRLGVPLPLSVGVWLVSDEEFGSTYGIKHLLGRERFRNDDLVVVPDSGTRDGRDIEIAEKGLLWFKLTTTGRQVHASLPGRGLNARRVGMNLAIDLDRTLNGRYAARDPLFNEPRSTFEPTKAEANVPNVNTVPGIDVQCFDCRVLPKYPLERVVADVGRVVRKHEKRTRASISLEVIQEAGAGPATPAESEAAALMAETVRRVVKVEPRFVGIGGQTVGNLFRKREIPTVVWSTVDDIPHEPNEYSRIKNLVGDAKVFAAMPLLAG
jgi:succinyl-diaminopimelate desuccinylase